MELATNIMSNSPSPLERDWGEACCASPFQLYNFINLSPLNYRLVNRSSTDVHGFHFRFLLAVETETHQVASFEMEIV